MPAPNIAAEIEAHATRAKTLAKRAVGRPPTYRPEMCQQVIDVMAQGYSLMGAAAQMNISVPSIYRWMDEHPEFQEAVTDGHARSAAYWEQRLRGVSEGEPGNATAILFGLRNRSKSPLGWHHDTQRVEHTGADGGPIKVDERKVVIDVTALDGEQREQLRALLLATQAPRQIEARTQDIEQDDDDDASAA
jgi:hypothetical protein